MDGIVKYIIATSNEDTQSSTPPPFPRPNVIIPPIPLPKSNSAKKTTASITPWDVSLCPSPSPRAALITSSSSSSNSSLISSPTTPSSPGLINWAMSTPRNALLRTTSNQRRAAAMAQTLFSYTPTQVLRHYAQSPQPLTEPLMESFDAAIFYADVANFTALADTLSKHKDSDSGSDRLTDLMNGYLGKIIDTIIENGGDIVEFAGDSFLAIWRQYPPSPPASARSATANSSPSPPSRASSNSEPSSPVSPPPSRTDIIQDLTLRALQCALQIQNSIARCVVSDVGSEIELNLRINIGAGPVFAVHCGGAAKRWIYLISGAEVDNTFALDKSNISGCIALTPAAKEIVQEHCVVEEEGGVCRVYAIKHEVDIIPLPIPMPLSIYNDLISSYVPQYVVTKLQNSRQEWIAEVRNVTVVFIKFPKSILNPLEPNYLSTLHAHCNSVVEIIAQSGGMLIHTSYDDKAIFGIPAYEDDIVRGVNTGIHIVRHFRELNLNFYVATGTVVVGSVGSAARCQYTLFGAAVNLSARLMQVAENNNLAILCDETTHR